MLGGMFARLSCFMFPYPTSVADLLLLIMKTGAICICLFHNSVYTYTSFQALASELCCEWLLVTPSLHYACHLVFVYLIILETTISNMSLFYVSFALHVIDLSHLLNLDLSIFSLHLCLHQPCPSNKPTLPPQQNTPPPC